MHSELEFPLLEYQVRLGCLEEEWEHPQRVQISIGLVFLQPPVAIETDRLADTICYAEIAKRIAQVCCAKSYHLIEHLAWCCLREMVGIVGPNIQVKIAVSKLRPPAPYFGGPAIFRLQSPPL